MTYQHWQLQRDEDHILWLTFNRLGTKVNTLNQEAFNELSKTLTELTANLPAGLIILSGKPRGFIAGADIKQFTTINTVDQAFDLLRSGQLILNQLQNLLIPTCALIRGFCLGGGLELALACRYRVVEDDPATSLRFTRGEFRVTSRLGGNWAFTPFNRGIGSDVPDG